MVRRAPRAWLAAAAARGAAGVAAAEAAEAAVAACADAALNLGPAPLGLPPLFQAPGPAPGLQEPPVKRLRQAAEAREQQLFEANFQDRVGWVWWRLGFSLSLSLSLSLFSL